MTLTLTGWILIVASIAVSALIIFPQRAAKPAFLSRLQSSGREDVQDTRGGGATLIVPAMVFLLVAGVGAAFSYVGDAATGPGEIASDSQTPSGPDGDMLANLKDYTRSVGADAPASKTLAAGQMLPDVNTMVDRLAERLKGAPNDLEGWRMLGWSYFNMGRYEEAATAYGKAVELDPNSADLKSAHQEAKAKAAGGSNSETPSSLETGADSKHSDALSAEKTAKSGTVTPHDGGTVSADAIRSMVDGLAARLESSPRDVEGWTRLMRSRVVLGEKDVAQTACNKALEVFKDDSAASGQITAAAAELGLKTE